MKILYFCGSNSVGRVSAFQADCREFESRLPLFSRRHGQVVRQKPAKLLSPVRIWVSPFLFNLSNHKSRVVWKILN